MWFVCVRREQQKKSGQRERHPVYFAGRAPVIGESGESREQCGRPRPRPHGMSERDAVYLSPCYRRIVSD